MSRAGIAELRLTNRAKSQRKMCDQADIYHNVMKIKAEAGCSGAFMGANCQDATLIPIKENKRDALMKRNGPPCKVFSHYEAHIPLRWNPRIEASYMRGH